MVRADWVTIGGPQAFPFPAVQDFQALFDAAFCAKS